MEEGGRRGLKERRKREEKREVEGRRGRVRRERVE